MYYKKRIILPVPQPVLLRGHNCLSFFKFFSQELQFFFKLTDLSFTVTCGLGNCAVCAVEPVNFGKNCINTDLRDIQVVIFYGDQYRLGENQLEV